jgi:hypothetical protein
MGDHLNSFRLWDSLWWSPVTTIQFPTGRYGVRHGAAPGRQRTSVMREGAVGRQFNACSVNCRKEAKT